MAGKNKQKRATEARKKAQEARDAGTSDSAASAQASVSETATAAPRKKTGPIEFFSQVRAEGEKVTWTSRNETFISTIMVLIMVVIAAAFFFSVDTIIRFVMPRLLSLGTVIQGWFI